MINFDLQNHRPLREIVYEELKRQIMIGEITPGTRMMEVELADEMGVSRTPIREAIRKLEEEGLVTIEPRRGAYASEVSAKEMVDVLEAREFIEGAAAELASKRLTSEQKEHLLSVAEEYAELIRSGDIEKIVKSDEDFHKLIVTYSGNSTIQAMGVQLQELSLRFRYIYFEDFSRFVRVPAEHIQIVEAIVSGDPTHARETMAAHIRDLKEFVESGNKQFKK